MLTHLGSSCDFPDPSLESVQGLRCDDALDLWARCKAESEKLSLLRSCHCTLRLIDLELEFARDESCNALHHSLTGLRAAHVDVAVIGVAGVAVSAAL